MYTINKTGLVFFPRLFEAVQMHTRRLQDEKWIFEQCNQPRFQQAFQESVGKCKAVISRSERGPLLLALEEYFYNFSKTTSEHENLSLFIGFFVVVIGIFVLLSVMEKRQRYGPQGYLNRV
jgi:hypothetical protein